MHGVCLRPSHSPIPRDVVTKRGTGHTLASIELVPNVRRRQLHGVTPPPTHTSVPPIQMERGRKIEELAEEDRKYVSDAYKREVVEAMSTSQV